jgi:hypothetical protein
MESEGSISQKITFVLNQATKAKRSDVTANARGFFFGKKEVVDEEGLSETGGKYYTYDNCGFAGGKCLGR